MRPIAYAAIASVLLLAACAPEAPGGGETVPPADAPPPATDKPPAVEPTTPIDPAAPFKQDFILIGTEPFWRVEAYGMRMVLKRPEPEPDLHVQNVGLAAQSGMAIWTGQAGDKTVVATIKAGECSDGMSDRKYPYDAEVKVGTDLTLKGCAISAEDFAKLPAS